MAQEFIQASFNSGEWAPHLWSRTDLEKYHTGAALLENWFVDYRGGASTRSGTKYIIRAYKDSTAVRLIGFQAAVSVGFVLEFGDLYIRFHRNGFPVLETALNITGASQTNPCVLTVANTFATGDVDWIYVTGVGGMTELNGKFFIVHASTATTLTIYDLFGNPVDASAFGAWTAGGTVQRIYTLTTEYAAADLALLKFAQNTSVMILCHPSYTPKTLTLNTATSWALADITFGASVSAPTGIAVATTLAGGNSNYSYTVTAVDADGEESSPGTPGALAAKQDIRLNSGTNTVTWNAVNNAISYNVYKSEIVAGVAVPAGAQYGFIGNCTGTTFVDSNIAQDYSQPYPIPQNPFETNQTVVSATVTNGGTYNGTVPVSMNFSSPPTGITALGYALFRILAAGATISNPGSGYAPGDTIFFNYGISITVNTVDGFGRVLTFTIDNFGSTSGPPSQTFAQVSTSGAGTGFVFAANWEVYSIVVSNGGSGYTVAPTISFSSGTAAATAVLSGTPTTVSNPSVPAFFQQRLVLAAPSALPQTLFFSQPGAYFNFDVSSPVQDDDAINGASIVTSQLNNIKSLVPQPGGLIVLTEGVSVLVNGGSQGSAVTPISITSNPQSFFGANDMPPIVVNYDVLSVPAKGSSVRDSTYNFYANVYTGADITTFSSHLFFGHQLLEWAWVEEPYKIVWAVRDDGALLSLTFVKEQEFIAWTHHVTEDGDALFKSVATIVETASVGYQNFAYFAVQRTINGSAVQYIEYFPERGTSGLARDYWTVDCGIQYSGAPATSFTGGEFLVGKTCTGLADGLVIPDFVMPASGNFTLATAASKVTVGLSFTCDLQTLYIDVPMQGATMQSKMKQIPQITLRVTEALGLKCGTDVSNLVTMKDLVIGNVGGMTNEVVTDLVTGDARTVIDPKWQEKGQIYIRQDQPYPASVLGFIPSMTVEGMKG